MSALIFIVVLLLLVLVHEFGHFIVAKKAGIRVDEFAFGFPPKLWSWKRGETTYALNALPIGGYVKIYGEDANDVSLDDRERSFTAQPRLVQGAVIVAGILCNLLFAWLLFTAAFMIGTPAPADGGDGFPVTDVRLMVTGVLPDSPALAAGLLSGDALLALSDGVSEVPVTTPEDVIAFVSVREGTPLTLSFARGGEEHTVAVTPVAGLIPDAAAIGISMDTIGTLRLPPHVALWEGLEKTTQFTQLIAVGIWDFLANIFVGRSDFSAVSGPVGIVREVGEAAGFGFTNLLLFTALISINLAVINIIPFPALDGGRLLFIVIEGVMRRPIKPVIANAFNIAGFALLMLLMVAVTYNDIIKILN